MLTACGGGGASVSRGGETPVPDGGDAVSGGETPVPDGGDAVSGGETPVPDGGDAVSGGETPVPDGDDAVSGGETPVPDGGDAVSGGETPVPDGDDAVSGGETPVPDGGGAVNGGIQFSDMQHDEIQKNIATAAVAEPKEGSVVQSSNVESGTTADSVAVDVTYNSESRQLAYRATKTAGTGGGIDATISSTSDEVLVWGNTPSNKYVGLHKKLPHGRLVVLIYTDNTPVIGSAPSVSTLSGVVDVPIGSMVLSGVLAIRSGGSSRLDGNFNGQVGTFSCPVGCRIVGGIITAGAWTFTPNSGGSAGSVVVVTQDTDYLAGGLWQYIPDGASSLADYEYGVFVDGNDKFTQGNLAGLTGTATYSANDGVTGVFANGSTGENTFFHANVSLNAVFGDANTPGTISGVINNVRERDFNSGSGYDSPIFGNPMLTLSAAMPETNSSSLFTGDTSMTFRSEDYDGKWGGQFYGNGDAVTDHPGSVAGTFGGATSDDSKSFLGIFGAHKDDE